MWIQLYGDVQPTLTGSQKVLKFWFPQVFWVPLRACCVGPNSQREVRYSVNEILASRPSRMSALRALKVCSSHQSPPNGRGGVLPQTKLINYKTLSWLNNNIRETWKTSVLLISLTVP